MEHLPVPRDFHGLELVPYVCSKPYDGGSFLEYPIREQKPYMVPHPGEPSFRMDFWHREQLHPTPNDELEDMFQRWLFFGLIQEFLGGLCTGETFIREVADGTLVLSTSNLWKLVEEWIESIKRGSLSVTYNHVSQCLHIVAVALRVAQPSFDANIKLSIASLGEVFENAANEAFQIENLTVDNKCPSAWHSIISDDFWKAIYFLTNTSQSEAPKKHGNCDEHKCVAYQNDLKAYKTKHRNPDCTCEELSVDTNSLDAILRDGFLPLLKVVEGDGVSELSVEVVSSQTDVPWVAISHVWADGLGNPRHNALPRCQVLHLHGLVQSLASSLASGHGPFKALLWLDTLCCPVAPEAAKSRALSEMKRTYQQATYVLVLESSMQPYQSNDIEAAELCAKILLSGWMRRLWTLQEGALAVRKRRLYFQFKDKAINFRELRLSLTNTYNTNLRRKALAINLMNRIAIFTAYSSLDPTTPGVDLIAVDEALQFRSVSVKDDEPILLGGLLDLQVSKILDGPKDTRMYRMWSLMPSALRGIPKTILFRVGLRLSKEGFRWAPATMMNSDQANANPIIMHGKDKEGHPTPRGLLVRLAGYTLSMAERPKGLPSNPWNKMDQQSTQTFHLRDSEGVWYILLRRLATTGSDFLSNMRLDDYIRGNSDVWIVHLDTDFQPRPDGSPQASTALLVKLIEKEGSVMYVRSGMHVHAMLLPNTYQEIYEAAYNTAVKLLQSPVARQLEEMSRQGSFQESLAQRALVDTIKADIHRIAATLLDDGESTNAAQKSSAHNPAHVEELISTYFIGHYANITAKLP
ncbi:MAG: hypothetical protein Q9218_000390, partial [Villophora microphyllina]